MTAGPKILTIDIESSPNLVYTWGLRKQTIALNQIRKPGGVISFGAKWYGKKPVEFRSDFHDGHEEMVERAHALLDEADIVVHYNGTSFDVPYLQAEFVQAGLDLPSPFRQVDLYRVVRRQFRFPSMKLDYVAQALGIGAKVKHEGFDLWNLCMEGDPKAWARMRRYNVGDVRLTEDLYDRLLPWIPSHPHRGLYSGEANSCQRCGSTDLQSRGSAYTPLGVYQQLRCNQCGSWSRGAKRLGGVETRGIQ